MCAVTLRIKLFLLLCLAWPWPAGAVNCHDSVFDDISFTICSVDVNAENLRLFLNDDTGRAFGSFHALPGNVEFAMNAGMYHADRSPVGAYVEHGQTLRRAVPGAGPGNFGMVPNGVFCIRDGRADVIETLEYIKTAPNCPFATQSGPMLVIDGQLHPRFLPGSTSRHIRNGVGTTADGTTAHFAISNQRVNFHTFARLFRDILAVPNALYFDGFVSRLYAPAVNRNDYGRAMGPIVAVVN